MVQTKLDTLLSRIDSSLQLLQSLQSHQQCQSRFIDLQKKIRRGGSITGELDALTTVAEEKHDIILSRLLERIPAGLREQGVPSTVKYYADFESLYKEARVRAKTPESSGFAGQLMGRTIVTLVGTTGLDPADPLVMIGMMNEKMDE